MQATCPRAITSDDYVPICVSMLTPDRLCGVSLYTRDSSHGPMRLFRAPELPITTEDLEWLASTGRSRLYLSAPEQREFQEFLRANLKEVLQDESRSVAQRFGNLNEVVRGVLGEAFANGDVGETVQQVGELGTQTVDIICRDDAVASELCSVLYHDYHTFTHSANVAYYTVMLARELGVTERDELQQLAAGALLHDLGKLDIPDDILTKPGKLSAEEFAVMKRHPTVGFAKLCERPDLSFGQLMMVYQHHERLDGSGYPVGISHAEVHPWARICAVADVFEALTSTRPYRAGLSFDETFRIMDRSAEMAFDRTVYSCWKATILKR